MHKITKVMYQTLQAACDRTVSKSQHNLITRMIPVNCQIALEIGMQLDARVVSEMKDVPPNVQAHTLVKLVDYAEALEAYGKKRWPAEKAKTLGDYTYVNDDPISEPTEGKDSE